MQTNLTRNILLSALFILIANPSIAQALYQVSLNDKVEKSSLIAEGKVIHQQAFWNAAQTMIYTSNTIEVYKVFKGNISPQHIEVLTVGGMVGLESLEASDLATLAIGEIGMFFCYPNSIGLVNPGGSGLLYDIYSSSQGVIKYNLYDETASAPFVKFQHITSDLYSAVENKTGESFKNMNPAFTATPPILPTGVAAPGISFFSPATVVAGASANTAQNLLTITGTNFGNAAGSAAVLFDDANDGDGGTDYSVPYSNNLVQSWTSTQIVISVPSRAGKGFIKVRDELGVITSSATQLEVLYSVLSATFSSGSIVTKQSNLMNSNGSGGYTFAFSTSTANGGVDLNASTIKATFLRALDTWKEISGVNFIEGATTTSQTVAGDGNNVIMFDNAGTGNSPLADGVLGTCYSWNSICTPILTNNVRKTGFDIVIRNSGFSTGSTTFENGPCYPAGADVDMETVLLHELGHALNLGHVNDDYQYAGGSYFNINPGKVMNYAIVNGVARKSPDNAAYTGASYCINPKGLTYGTCTTVNTEMVPLSVTLESKDECPVFPSTATPGNSLVHFDLVHATSNKYTDPQYTAVNCAGTGTGVINTAYFAIKTNTTAAATLSLQVLNYTTLPASLAGCASQGITLTLYPVSACPLGQSFPMPTTCRTFTADGTISNITGLAANTTYLMMASGINGTKASFDLLINGNALPINVRNFSGTVKPTFNELIWKLDIDANVNEIALEAAADRIHFSEVHVYQATHVAQSIDEVYQDAAVADNKYYRLRITYIDGRVEYSEILLLKRSNNKTGLTVTPNPAIGFVNVDISSATRKTIILNLVDATGKTVLTKQIQLIQGRQVIQVNQLQQFARGIYMLQVNDGEKTTTQKIVLN